MIKKRTLWIILFYSVFSLPFKSRAQEVEIKDGSLIIDFKPNKEKKKKDTREFVPPDYDPNKRDIFEDDKKLDREESDVDLSKESLFKALFSAGVNICQVDGDNESGYKKAGANVGVGTLVKFHKNVSVSLELLYSMKGARPKYNTLADGSKNYFDITYDYIDLPLSLNVHDKKFVMASAGLSFGTMMRYKETSYIGNTTTGSAPPDTTLPGYSPPRKFDLSFQAGFQFLIKRVVGVGVRFQYTILSLRPSYGVTTKVKGQYNNMFTFRLTYILDPKALKSQKKKR